MKPVDITTGLQSHVPQQQPEAGDFRGIEMNTNTGHKLGSWDRSSLRHCMRTRRRS